MKNEANLTPMNTLIKTISWLWLLTGIIIGLIGIWIGSLYFLFAGYKTGFEALRAENEVLDNVLKVIDALPLIATITILLSFACVIAGLNLPKFKKWSLPLIEILSYFIVCAFSALLILWFKIWLFSFQNTPNYAGSSVWEIIGLITGTIVCLFFVVVFIFILKNIRNKTFRQIYNEKVKLLNP
jgi:hypothetical protein